MRANMLLGYFTVFGVLALNVWFIVRGMRKSRRLKRAVFTNLDHAFEGGYFEPGQVLHGATPAALAYDLSMGFLSKADLEGEDTDRLLVYVRDWQRQRGLK